MYAEGKLDTDRWYPVVLLDDTDFKTGETGKVVAGLTIKYRRLGDAASWETYSPAAGDWQETGDGTYALNMGAGEFTTAKGAGIYQVQVACSGCLTFRFPVEVRKYLIQDFFSDYNVIMKLNQLDIESQVTNEPGIKVKGNGNGGGIQSTGGATGPGATFLGGATSGAGMVLDAVTEGDGLTLYARGSGANGISCSGEGAGSGIQFSGGTTGYGIKVYGGSTSGAAIYAEARGGNSQAVELLGIGTGAGLRAQGGYDGGSGLVAVSGFGATGDGIRAEARSTNGNGINCIKTGTGIDLKASDHSDGTWGHSVKKNTAIAKYKFVMLHETSGDPEPGLTVTAVKKLDAAAAWSAMSGSGTIVDNGSGVYSIDISQADSNGDTGVWKFTAPGAKATIISLMFES